MIRLLTKILVLFIVLAGVAGVGTYIYVDQQMKKSVQIPSPVLFVVKNGEPANRVLRALKSQSIIDDILGLKIALKVWPKLAHIKAGTYEILPAMTVKQVLNLFLEGTEKQFTIGLVEGMRWRDWKAQMQGHAHLVFDQDTENFIAALQSDLPIHSIEGWLLADTYHFTSGTNASVIISKAYHNMQNLLEVEWQQRALSLPYDSPFEGLIMASIIEKETGLGEERPRIAGVFVNRLNQNMRLQTDPTVIYGLGDNFDGNIRRKDLKTPTPYNTYVIKGLPPTPIAMPSKLAVQATFHPLETDELYFVAKGDGSHQFSVSLKEHNQAVRQYQLKK